MKNLYSNVKMVGAGEIGSLTAGESLVRMKQRHDKIFAIRNDDLTPPVTSALIRVNRTVTGSYILGIVALAVALLVPEVDSRLLSLILAAIVFPSVGICTCSAVSTLRGLDGLFRDGVILTDEFRHELMIFRDSDAGRDMVEEEKAQLEMFAVCPDFAGWRRACFHFIWVSAAVAALMLVLVATALALLPQ